MASVPKRIIQLKFGVKNLRSLYNKEIIISFASKANDFPPLKEKKIYIENEV